jgi:hypothetical protein
MIRLIVHIAKKSALFALCLIFSATFVHAQLREDLRNELLIYIQPSALEFPTQYQRSIRIENLNIPNSKLRSALSRFQIGELQKAFPGIMDADTINVREDGTRVSIPQVSRIFKVRVPNYNDIDSAIAHLSKIPGVLFAEKHSEMRLHLDDYYPNQWHLNNTGQSGGTVGADIDAPEAWRVSTGSSSVKLGVIDCGVEITHDDLTGKSTGDLPENFPYNGYAHGTHVAGIAAAKHGNVGKVRGVDANVQVIAKKVFSGYYYNPNDGEYHPDWAGDNNAYTKIVEAVNSGVHVLNNSWGGSGYSTTLRLAFTYAYKMDRVSVVSMGNNGNNTPIYPAAFSPGVIAVGATTGIDGVAYFSNYGNHIDVVAPGANITST